MKQQTAILVLLAAIVAVAAIGGAIFYWQGQEEPQAAGGVPPLPPGTRSFGNWALACGQNAENRNRCSLLIRVINEETQRIVTSINLTRGPQGNAIFVVTTPPGVVIPNGVSLTPDGGTAARGAVQVCRPTGCTGIVILNDMLVSELSAVDTMALGYTAANGRDVSFNLPVSGFAEGYTAWRQAYPAPPPPDAEADAEAGAEAGAEEPPAE